MLLTFFLICVDWIKEQIVPETLQFQKGSDNDICWRHNDGSEHRSEVGAQNYRRLCLVDSILEAAFSKDSGGYLSGILCRGLSGYESMATESAVRMGKATGRNGS